MVIDRPPEALPNPFEKFRILVYVDAERVGSQYRI
jgi:hypothetical protein